MNKKLYQLINLHYMSGDVYEWKLLELDEAELTRIKPLVNFCPDGTFRFDNIDTDAPMLEPIDITRLEIPALEPAIDTILEGVVDNAGTLNGWSVLNFHGYGLGSKQQPLHGARIRVKVIAHRLVFEERTSNLRVVPRFELLEVLEPAPPPLKGQALIDDLERRGITVHLRDRNRILRDAGEDV